MFYPCSTVWYQLVFLISDWLSCCVSWGKCLWTKQQNVPLQNTGTYYNRLYHYRSPERTITDHMNVPLQITGTYRYRSQERTITETYRYRPQERTIGDHRNLPLQIAGTYRYTSQERTITDCRNLLGAQGSHSFKETLRVNKENTY